MCFLFLFSWDVIIWPTIQPFEFPRTLGRSLSQSSSFKTFPCVDLIVRSYPSFWLFGLHSLTRGRDFNTIIVFFHLRLRLLQLVQQLLLDQLHFATNGLVVVDLVRVVDRVRLESASALSPFPAIFFRWLRMVLDPFILQWRHVEARRSAHDRRPPESFRIHINPGREIPIILNCYSSASAHDYLVYLMFFVQLIDIVKHALWSVLIEKRLFS